MYLDLKTFFSNYIINWYATHLTTNEKFCTKVVSILLGIFTLGVPHLTSLFYQKVIAKSWDNNHSPTVQKVNNVFKNIFKELSITKINISSFNNKTLSPLKNDELIKSYKRIQSEINKDLKDPAATKILQTSLHEIKDMLIRKEKDLAQIKEMLLKEGIVDAPLLSAIDVALDKNKRSFVNTINDLGVGILQKPAVANPNPRILHVSLEFTKAKVGGVGAVTESLLAKSRESGIDARIATPFYSFYENDPEFKNAKFQGFVDHLYEGVKVRSSIYKIFAQKGTVPQYLIKPDPAYSTLFHVEMATSLYDTFNNVTCDERKFYMASASASMAACYKGKGLQSKNIDIVQVHDSGSLQLITKLLNDVQNPEREKMNLAKIYSVLHYHHGAYTHYSYLTSHTFKGIGLNVPFGIKDPVALSWNNADAFVLVSDEMVKTSLDKVKNPYLNKINHHLNKHGRLKGVINGINHKHFDITNPQTYGRFAIQPQDGVETDYLCEKAKIKQELFEAGIIGDPIKPLFFFVGRLCVEKGVDMLPILVEEVRKQGGQAVVMGTQFEHIPKEVTELIELSKKYPDTLKVYTHIKDQTDLFKDTEVSKGHLIRAAGDFSMVPSHFESCGLVPPETNACGNITFTSYAGGLKDVCRGMGHLDPGGNIITIDNFDAFTYSQGSNKIEDAKAILKLAFDFYKDLKVNNPKKLNEVVGRIIEDSRRFDWLVPNGAIDKFKEVYQVAMRPRTDIEKSELHDLKIKYNEIS